jgi:hypothetical protein
MCRKGSDCARRILASGAPTLAGSSPEERSPDGRDEGVRQVAEEFKSFFVSNRPKLRHLLRPAEMRSVGVRPDLRGEVSFRDMRQLSSTFPVQEQRG